MNFADKSGARAQDHNATLAADRPIVIADHALIGCDLTFEILLAYLKSNPRRLVEVMRWLLRGRAHAARQLASRVQIDTEALPVNDKLARFAEVQASAGRSVFIAATFGYALARALAVRLPFVTGTIAADERQTADAPALAGCLAARFPQGFDYAGGAAADLDIWRRASAAILVDASPRVERRASALLPVAAVISRPSRLQGLLESFRLHQWVKNLLVFAPIVLGGQITDPGALAMTIIAFLALSLAASSTYLINDILDVADDRRHWSKRERPIATGRLGASAAAVSALAGLATSLALGAWVSLSALGVLLIYIGVGQSYSWGLKRLPLVDGLVLATQFTLRLALGVVAAQVPPSPWLFVFSMFLFTSLSLAKRYTELGRLGAHGGRTIAGRGYRAEDAPLVLAVGIAAGLAATVILILYIIDDAFRQSFYGSTLWLWGFPPLIMLLICRIWLVTVRGEMNDDPVRFMLGDRVCQSLLAALVVCFVFAWLA